MTTAAASANGHPPATPREAAAFYIERGFAPIPLPPRSKRPVMDGWPDLRVTADTIDAHFPTGADRNLGLLLGIPSHGLIDVDLDEPEAIRAAPFFLQPTGWISGRKSRPRSHWWYTVDDPPDKAAETFKDLDGAMLVELRSSGGQTVAPPGVHESGEKIGWYESTEPAHVGASELRKAVATTAAAALLGRHWPAEGGRQDAALALAGGLARAGWTADGIEHFIRAAASAADDDEIEMRCNVAGRSAERIKEGKHAWGWPKLAEALGENGKAVVGKLREWLGTHDRVAAAAADVTPQAPPWPDPPAAEAFHGLPGRIVRTIEPASEADPAALLVQALACFGNVIGRAAHFTVESDRHRGNEFVVLVGRTSKARKGTSFGRINRLFEEAEEQWAAERIQSGLSSGEGLIWAVRDPIVKRERVKDKGEVRYEEVEADPGVADKRLLVYEPEFANVLKQTERQGNTLSVIVRNAWDGRPLRSMTKNSPARATGAHVSLIGHITADELRRYLTETETANGFANRFLWVCVQRSKQLPEGGAVDAAAMAAHRDELVEALAFARAADEVRRDEEARAVWCDIYGELSEGKPGLAGALLARGEAHVMRLALLYALMDRSPLIQAPHLTAALALWDYVERSVCFTFGDTLGDPIADDLLRLLRGCPSGLTRNDIRNYFQRNVAADRIGRALGLLLQHKLARREQEQTGGRPAERWYAVARKGG